MKEVRFQLCGDLKKILFTIVKKCDIRIKKLEIYK